MATFEQAVAPFVLEADVVGDAGHDGRMLLEACVNGARRPHEHPRLPVTAALIAAAVAAAAVAGAGAVHVHVKDGDGGDVMDGAALAAVLVAAREAAPGVPVGVTTGAWVLPDPAERMAAIRGWGVLPDFASVNWHEDGADDVAAVLLELGVGVEAGLWHAAAVDAWLASEHRDRCMRVLLELPDGLDAVATEIEAARLLQRVRAGAGGRVPVLLHGEGSSTWPALRCAGSWGLDTRIGFEDTLVLPDGSPARDNTALVRAARTLLRVESPGIDPTGSG